jgi:hypothetical protein
MTSTSRRLRVRGGRCRVAGRAFLALILAGFGSAPAGAQTAADEAAKPIQDNSFLIEEAYNQERGVVQHIGVYARERESGLWIFTFTQEWPFPSQRHQLSYSIPLLSPGPGITAGVGDVALNYRYQIVGAGNSRLFVAPRISVLLPSGDERRDRGSGGTGLQFNLPVSLQHTPGVVTHWNAGLTVTRGARNAVGQRATTRGYNAGASGIWLFHPLLNAMLELAWDRSEIVTGPDTRSASEGFVLSPGLRAAINLSSGLQIVPGVALPIGLGPSAGERAVLLYLSFEHPFTRSRATQ